VKFIFSEMSLFREKIYYFLREIFLGQNFFIFIIIMKGGIIVRVRNGGIIWGGRREREE
jgi:hypothetical protein